MVQISDDIEQDALYLVGLIEKDLTSEDLNAKLRRIGAYLPEHANRTIQRAAEILKEKEQK